MKQNKKRRKPWLYMMVLFCTVFLCSCHANENTVITQNDYLQELAIPVLRQVGEEMVHLGSFSDDLQKFCVSSEEVRQNFDYVLLAERLATVKDTIEAYPKAQVPQEYQRLHTNLLDLASVLDDFLHNYPEILMRKDEQQLSLLFQQLYQQLHTGLNRLPDSLSALTGDEVMP